ncbi:MAG: alpha/beta hydrolase [Halomonadaceae bacterium]|nr:MAG: alpha/beta hydrolase [Halomonadaceae bacterium]
MPELNLTPRHVRYPLPGGQILSALVWGDTQHPPLLALHGWLDNAASFNLLAPLLARHFQVISLDLPGHGYSSHRPPGGDYGIPGYVVDIAQFMDSYLPQGAAVLGHSLGGIVASLLAAVQPERVTRLGMIDSLGPQVTTPEAFTVDLGKAVKRRVGERRSVVPQYDSLEQALAARKGGWLPLTDTAAAAIVPRNLCPCEQGWTWRTDPRLRYSSLHKFTEPQVTAALAAIQCPVLLLEGADGLLVKAQAFFAGRHEHIAQLQTVRVPGSHHCHLDGDIHAMADLLTDFFTDH